MSILADRRASVRRMAAAGVAVAALLTVAPHDARAQTVTCLNCSTATEQLLQYAKQAQGLVTQLQQYQLQIEQYANMVTNTAALPQQMWGNAQADIMQVRALSNAGAILSGNSGGIVARLESAGAYGNQVGALANIPGQFTMWQQTIGNNLNTMGRTLGLQQQQQASETAVLQTLQQHSSTAQGQMQALQAGNELAGANALQLAQIQATLTETAQMQAVDAGVAADRQATQDAAMLHFAQPVAVPIAGRNW
jgi:P-type conjugative transfer protein TrbJ